MSRIRINIQITDSLLEKVDEYAENLNLSRSAFVSMAISKYIQQEQLLEMFPEFVKMVKAEQAKQLAE